ncbi:MAG TPA: PAS domain S-box protein [Burkholderiales bacterium]
MHAAAQSHTAFLSTVPAAARGRHVALTTLGLSVAIFLLAAPFAKAPLAPVPVFLPLYQSALVLSDLMTCVLLFGQFSILRSRGLLLLASGYLFSALMAVSHALSFPGLFATTGLFGAGPQTTAWLYFLWHAGFPILVIAYALQRDAQPESDLRGESSYAVAASIAMVALAVVGLTALTTAGHDALPVIMQGNRDAPAKVIVAAATWILSLAAFVLLWRRQPHSVLDLWLAVTMCAWIFDVALAAVLNAGRFDLGWYAGRVYGLLASGFVLTVLLLENNGLHARLARANRELDDLYNQAPCGYHSVDENGLIIRMNDTWLRWLGYSREEVVGKLRHADLMTPQCAERFWKEVFPLFKKQGWLKEVQFDYVRKDGTTFPASLQTSTIYDRQGRYLMSRTTVFDITEAKRTETALRDAEQRIRLLIDGVKDYAILTLDPEGRIISWNAGAQLIKGYAAKEIIGQHFSVFYPQDKIDAGWPQRELELAASRGHFEDEGWRLRRDGSRFWANVIITAMRDESGALRGYSKITRDLSERRRAEEAVQALNKELESFTYSVSHDLRAPLRAVDGYGRMLDEDYGPSLDEEGRRMLGMVRSSARQMAQLIDDLLAFSRLGRQEPNKIPVEMGQLVREVSTELVAPGAPVSLQVRPLPPARADRMLLRQVWTNLVSNALKYSGKRECPEIEIAGREEAAENVYWVRDNGAGFDMRYAHKLFGVFQRLHAMDEFPGTGVGLAIVQRVVTRHGGRVWAEGAPDAGACFYFSLPREVNAN